MDSWTLIYDGFDPEQEGLREALCTVGNGYFATRGAAPEAAADDVHYPGTYLAMGYNRLRTEIAGRIVENEDLVNLPHLLALTFRIENGEWFDLRKVEILDFRQELDLKAGLMTRTVRFRDAQERRTRLTQRRFVHMAEPHLAGLETTWLPENWSGRIEVRAPLDGRVVNAGVPRYRNLNGRHLVVLETLDTGDGVICLKVQTTQSELRIALAARTRLQLDPPSSSIEPRVVVADGSIEQAFVAEVAEGHPLRAEKLVALHTSRDRAISECGLAAREAATGAPDFATLTASHRQAWSLLWEQFDMDLAFSRPPRTPNHTTLILRLHLFHLLQTTSPHSTDLDVGVPSRGWHGEAYRGHIFWDELFIFPLLNLRTPAITRALLRYRYRRLSAARDAARRAGYEGAMYPWQSGSDGREESQVVHLNPKSGRWLPDHSHLQRHVNAAIAYNIWEYFQATGDREFLYEQGAEMILEIARFWSSLATYDATEQRFEIRGVMGPDEYHDGYPDATRPGLNNNAYTNLMAVWVCCRALDLLATLPADHLARLRTTLALREEEVQRWDDLSRRMRLVFHAGGILSQFEGYGDLREFDWATYRRRHGPVLRLDRILEAEGDSPNHYKASKQADVLMLFHLFSAAELEQLFRRLEYPFSPDDVTRNIDYYLERTANGSTLSHVVSSWVLARSDRARSWDLFTAALQSDVSDVQGGTTAEGIHLGAMAGTVDLVQRCYTGIEMRQDVLWLNPLLPPELTHLRLRLRYRHAALALAVDHRRLQVTVIHCPAEPIRIGFGGQIMTLGENDRAEFDLPPPPAGPLQA